MALGVLHLHDGIVHHQADHEHEGEQGESIQAVAHHQQKGEATAQRERHRDERDEGGAEGAEEQHHDQNYQPNRHQNSRQHLVDGCVDEGGVVIHNVEFHAWRQGGAQPRQHLPYGMGDINWIGLGLALQPDSQRLPPV